MHFTLNSRELRASNRSVRLEREGAPACERTRKLRHIRFLFSGRENPTPTQLPELSLLWPGWSSPATARLAKSGHEAKLASGHGSSRARVKTVPGVRFAGRRLLLPPARPQLATAASERHPGLVCTFLGIQVLYLGQGHHTAHIYVSYAGNPDSWERRFPISPSTTTTIPSCVVDPLSPG